MRRHVKLAIGLLVTVVLAAPACGSPDSSCTIWDVMDRRLADVAYTDCGSVDARDEIALQEAHDCVAVALARGQPFSVIWTLWGIDAGIADAYLSRDGVTVERLAYDGDAARGDGRLHSSTSRWSCDSFAAMDSCSSFQLSKFLCFECRLTESAETCESVGPA